MKASVMELWQLLKSQTGWDSLTIKQKLITFWWSLSFCGFAVSGSLLVTAIIVANFASASYCMVKYVPEPKDE
jgi:hypothetical protein